MTVKLTIELEGPVGPEDKDILTGATMILMALAQQTMPPAEEEEEEEEDPQPTDEAVEAFVAILTSEPQAPEPCSITDASGLVCQGAVGHRGRHLFRRPAAGVN